VVSKATAQLELAVSTNPAEPDEAKKLYQQVEKKTPLRSRVVAQRRSEH